MKWCQLLVLVYLSLGFFACLYRDFHGAREREPGGFRGAVWTIALTWLIGLMFWGAVAFSEWLP